MAELVYCPDCKSHNSWVRDSKQDRLTETGKVFMWAYRCTKCGTRIVRGQPREEDNQ